VTEDNPPFKRNEYRRYRQLLFGAYGIIAGVGFAWITATVLWGAFRPEANRTHAAPDKLETPAECQKRVERLFQDLGLETSELLLGPQKGTKPNTSSEWEAFSTTWLEQWITARVRCGFGENPRERQATLSKMAVVHEDLPAMRRKYQNLLVRFEEQQAAELARMRDALERSSKSLPTTETPTP